MTESRRRQKIRKIAASHGAAVEWMEWQPIGAMIEMQGREGGWTVWLDDGTVVTFFALQDAEEAFRLTIACRTESEDA